MATIETLIDSGQLVKVSVGKRSAQVAQRLLLASPEAVTWMKTDLKAMESDGFHLGALSPALQVLSHFEAFVLGKDLAGELEPHIMNPHRDGIWTHRTHDVRLYGWFPKRCVFVVASAVAKAQVKGEAAEYEKQLKKTRDFRRRLRIDQPDTVLGSLEDVCGL